MSEKGKAVLGALAAEVENMSQTDKEIVLAFAAGMDFILSRDSQKTEAAEAAEVECE